MVASVPATTLAGIALALGGLRVASAALDRVFERRAAGSSEGADETATTAAELRRSDLSKLLVAGAVVAFVLLVEGRSLSSVGLQPVEPLRFAGVVAAGLALTLGASAAANAVAERLGFDDGGTVADLGRLPAASRLRVAVVAGVTEELLFRGYLVERLLELTGDAWLAGAASLVAFVVAHYGYWDAEESVGIAAVSVPLVALYLLTRSLPVVVAVHVLHDSVGLWVAGRMDEGAGDEGAVGGESTGPAS